MMQEKWHIQFMENDPHSNNPGLQKTSDQTMILMGANHFPEGTTPSWHHANVHAKTHTFLAKPLDWQHPVW